MEPQRKSARKGDNASGGTCPSGHALKYQFVSNDYSCDVCGEFANDGAVMWDCAKCDWCKCEKCAEKPPCPCCKDRKVLGKWTSPAPEAACEICRQPRIDGDALIAELLSGPIRLRWDLTPAEIDACTVAYIKRGRAACEKVVAASKAARDGGAILTWDTCMTPLMDWKAESSPLYSTITYLGAVSPDNLLRATCRSAEKRLDNYQVEEDSRKDVYEVMVAFSRQVEVETSEGRPLVGEPKRALEDCLLGFEHMGLKLEDPERERVVEITKQVDRLEREIIDNINEDESFRLFTAEQLSGCPASYLEERKQEDKNDSYKVTFQGHDYDPLMKRCNVPETRKEMEKAFYSIGKEKTKTMEKLLALRHEKANVLGFENHVALRTAFMMSKSPARVKSFLLDLQKKTKPHQKRHLAELCKLKELIQNQWIA